eukprot:scaffold20551_cov60-Cyclotella_meneghiniana.AAC.4
MPPEVELSRPASSIQITVTHLCGGYIDHQERLLSRQIIDSAANNANNCKCEKTMRGFFVFSVRIDLKVHVYFVLCLTNFWPRP